MASLYHIKCHKILDQHNEVKVVVAHVHTSQDHIAFVVHTEHEVLKMFMFATNGDLEHLSNGTNN